VDHSARAGARWTEAVARTRVTGPRRRGGYGSSELIGDSRGGREEDGGFILTLTGPRAAARRWCGDGPKRQCLDDGVTLEAGRREGGSGRRCGETRRSRGCLL
jgi:hypothetical protein